MKFGEIIFSGSEVTVRTKKCDVRTDVQTDVTEPNTIAPPAGREQKKGKLVMLCGNACSQLKW
jgi:hypothetical protein